MNCLRGLGEGEVPSLESCRHPSGDFPFKVTRDDPACSWKPPLKAMPQDEIQTHLGVYRPRDLTYDPPLVYWLHRGFLLKATRRSCSGDSPCPLSNHEP